MHLLKISPRFLLLALLLSVSRLSAQTPANYPDTASWKIRLVFVGDIMGHESQIRSAEIEKDKLFDYSPCFQYVEPILKQAGLAIGNLELTLPGAPPYTGYPRFRSPDDLALALRYAGFDLLLTANNHSNDAGADGLIRTIEALDNYGFYHTGTFQSEEEKEAYYPLIVYKDNFKLAFLNYTYDTNGLPTRLPTVVNLIDHQQIETDMATARALKPDAIIVVMHWGNEYQIQESQEQRDLAGKLLEWGADLVIGAHPHVVQPVREYLVNTEGREPKKALVAYSLGNFISGQNKLNTDGGLMLEVELEKDKRSNATRLGSHSYIPVWRYIRKDASGKPSFLVLPISALENDESNPLDLSATDRAAMLKYAKTLRTHLSRYESTERLIARREILTDLPQPEGTQN